jgi:hypothetical protein
MQTALHWPRTAVTSEGPLRATWPGSCDRTQHVEPHIMQIPQRPILKHSPSFTPKCFGVWGGGGAYRLTVKKLTAITTERPAVTVDRVKLSL